MAFIENIKKLSTFGHLPNFGILSKNKLYLPNLNIDYSILGKWSLDWLNSERYLLGLVEQDDFKNIKYKITSCYEYTTDSQKLISLLDFKQYWQHVYTYDVYLSPIIISISEYYQDNQVELDKKKSLVPPKTQEPLELPKEQKETVFKVCKTDKPDVYHVYKNNKYESTCLIPNMKISRYMQELFENKSIGESLELDMKLHEKTGKYYPKL